MKVLIHSWSFALVAVPYILPSVHGDPLVELSYGSLVGVVQSSSDTVGFYGVPFAQPPVGALRFQPPQPINKTLGQIDATKPAASCFRIEFNPTPQDSEDCLYLDVVVPQDALEHTSKHGNGADLPVIVFIHGLVFYSTSLLES